MRQKRVIVTHYGGPEVITTVEEDIPTPKASEVRVKVLAAGISLPNVLAREGVHPETPRVPYTPGWDLVGTVDQLGEGVTGFKLRQTVAAMPIHGATRSTCACPNASLSPSLRDWTQRRRSPWC
jgi:NADPH2:quinone reductase